MNIYWPIYLNIESEVNKLMYAIHMSDDNKRVYSSIISDLILRCSAEIESLSKELYRANGGTKVGNLAYDHDCLKFLDKNWNISKKKVYLTSVNCFFSQKELTPFQKTVNRTGTEKPTYLWNNAYQNLKHDRGNSLSYGNVEALFEILAALFVLNLYFTNINYELGKDAAGTKIDWNLGSSIFSVSFYIPNQVPEDKSYFKTANFDSFLYIRIPDPTTHNVFVNAVLEQKQKGNELMKKKLTENMQILAGMSREEIVEFCNELKKDSIMEAFKLVGPKIYETQNNITYVAELNKNQI